MIVRDALIATLRTVVQGVIAGLAIWLGRTLGIEIPEDWVLTTTLLVLGLVVFLLNEAGQRWPWINRLLSLGLSPTPPAYEGKHVR